MMFFVLPTGAIVIANLARNRDDRRSEGQTILQEKTSTSLFEQTQPHALNFHWLLQKSHTIPSLFHLSQRRRNGLKPGGKINTINSPTLYYKTLTIFELSSDFRPIGSQGGRNFNGSY